MVWKKCIKKSSELYRDVTHEDYQRLDKGISQLSSLHILRKLYLTLATNSSLSQYYGHMDMSTTKWVGDHRDQVSLYMRMMSDHFEGLAYFTKPQQRDIIAGHMTGTPGKPGTKDSYLINDLVVFKRAGGLMTFGKEYCFEFLWESLKRRVAEQGQHDAEQFREAARARR